MQTKLDTSTITKIAQNVRAIIFPMGSRDNQGIRNGIKHNLTVPILYTSSQIAWGYTRWDERRHVPEIVISRSLSEPLQDHAIVHELGHLFLHWRWTPGKDIGRLARRQYGIIDVYRPYPVITSDDTDGDDIIVELEADELAESILMPVDTVRTIYRHADDQDFDHVKYLISKQLDVTLDSAYHRLCKLRERKELR